MKRLLFVVVLLAGFVASAFAQARPTLGVLPFAGGAQRAKARPSWVSFWDSASFATFSTWPRAI